MTAHAERSAGVWEPWSPQVGDRIRCNPSPECDAEWLTPGIPRGHSTAEIGALGTVITRPGAWSDESLPPGHLYAVDFDQIIIRNGLRVWGGMFAAVELVPLTAARVPDEREVSGG